MSHYFKKLMDAGRQDVCFNHLSDYETKILTAWRHLQAAKKSEKNPNNADKKAFIDACKGGQCEQAVESILKTIDGSGSFLQCNMNEILYNGDAHGTYYRGARDDVVLKSSYLVTLAHMGVIVQAAYTTFENPKDANAW